MGFYPYQKWGRGGKGCSYAEGEEGGGHKKLCDSFNTGPISCSQKKKRGGGGGEALKKFHPVLKGKGGAKSF